MMSRRLRLALTAPAVAIAALAASQQLSAQSAFNSNAPVDYAADRIELQDKQNRVVLSGNVDIKQGDLRLKAERTVVDFTDAGSLKIQRITASGGVVVTRADQVATGSVGIYDFNQRIITMTGDATLKRGSTDTLRGNRFVIDLKSGVSSAESGPGGRVSGTFSVPKQN